jgi:protoporphyrinogen oxidase
MPATPSAHVPEGFGSPAPRKAAEQETQTDLIVLGAGPAGLAAAWRAARAGRSVVVLERAAAVGGMAASFEVAGVRVDHGSHRLHPATPPHIMAALRELLGDDLQTRPRHGRLRIGSRWVGFPLRAGDLVRALPPRMVAGIARDAVVAPARRVREDTYADVLRRGLGPTLYDALYAPYAVKLWGLDPTQISGEQARRRVTADTPWKVAARVLRGARGTGQGQVFHYPRRGFGQIVDVLRTAAVDAGAQIRVSCAAQTLDVSGPLPVVRPTDGRAIEAHRVFSTMPLPVLARVAAPAAPADVAAAAKALRFRGMVLVYLVHAGGRWTDYDAHYLPGLDTPVTRISEPANYRASADDPADRSVLCAELPCAEGDALWTAPDEKLADVVVDAVRRTGLPVPQVDGVVVRRLPHVYPIYERGFERHLATLADWADALPGVTTFGRLGLFVHDNTHHALAMAWDAAAALGPDGAWDAGGWAAAKQRFAEHVVED